MDRRTKSPLPNRLEPGDDLRRALGQSTASRGGAVALSGIGSRSGCRLRLAGEADKTVFDGPFEIVSLAGTLTPDGVHLTAGVSDARRWTRRVRRTARSGASRAAVG